MPRNSARIPDILVGMDYAFSGMNVDYAMLVKIYSEASESQKRYSPAECIGRKIENHSAAVALYFTLRTTSSRSTVRCVPRPPWPLASRIGFVGSIGLGSPPGSRRMRVRKSGVKVYDLS